VWGNLWFLGTGNLTGPKESDGDTKRAMVPKMGKQGCSQQERLRELHGVLADKGEEGRSYGARSVTCGHKFGT
jgi:hypothetical protein